MRCCDACAASSLAVCPHSTHTIKNHHAICPPARIACMHACTQHCGRDSALTPPLPCEWACAPAGFDTNTSPPAEAIMEEQTHSGASTPTASAGAAPPPQLVAAFLQAQTAAAPATRHVVLRSSASVNSDDGDVLLLHNPFAAASTEQQQQQCCPSMPALASSHQPAAPASTTATRKQRTLLQRLVRGLMVTAASAGLVALGAWGGSAAYK